MPFLILGLVMTAVGIFFTFRSVHRHDKEGIIGSIALIATGLVLTIIFGVFYRFMLMQS